MTVADICRRDVAIAVKNETIVDAANHMRTAHVGDLVVIETRQNRRVPVGIITDRDIVVGAVAGNSGHLDTLVVGDLMTPEPATVREADPLEGALKTMEERGVRRLPVVDREGALVGIVTLDDALLALAQQQARFAKVALEQQRHERRFRV
jgi:predicted transcriptional regulator